MNKNLANFTLDINILCNLTILFGSQTVLKKVSSNSCSARYIYVQKYSKSLQLPMGTYLRSLVARKKN